jgi:hypothetical protein
MSDPWDDDASLVDRLRWHARNDYLSTPVVDALKEAADEIERLQADRDEWERRARAVRLSGSSQEASLRID